MFKKIISVILAMFLVIIGFAGCGSSNKSGETQGEANESDDKFKVALILPGTVNDKSWSALAVDAINELKDEYDATVKYNESVSPSDAEQIFRGYANQGYDFIIGHGYEFSDAAKTVAAEYPESVFCISNGTDVVEPNLGAMSVDSTAFGFILGAVSAVLSENNNIGIVMATETPPMRECEVGYEAGARYANPETKINMIYSGTIDDAAKVKENALSMIQNGADVISQNADHASLGALTACEEKGVLNIGAIGDQSDVGTNTVVVNVMQDISKMIVAAGKLVAEGEFEAQRYSFGINESAIYLSDYTGVFPDRVTDEKKAQIKQILDDLASGKIDIDEEISKNTISNR